jgi:hypothetical protein
MVDRGTPIGAIITDSNGNVITTNTTGTVVDIQTQMFDVADLDSTISSWLQTLTLTDVLGFSIIPISNHKFIIILSHTVA